MYIVNFICCRLKTDHTGLSLEMHEESNIFPFLTQLIRILSVSSSSVRSEFQKCS